MKNNNTRFRATIDKPNNIRQTVNSLFEQLETRIEHKTDCDIEEKNKQKTKIRNQKHNIKMLVKSICSESGMSKNDTEEFISKAFESQSNPITLEINYGSGRVGVEVSEGKKDVFSSNYDDYMFKIPKRYYDDSIKDLKDEISSKSIARDDGVGFAICIDTENRNKLSFRAYVFDRPNEILLQKKNRSVLSSLIP